MGLDLLAQGRGIGEVAALLGVDDSTVFRWRDSPEGRARLAAAFAEREKARGEIAEAQRDTVAEAKKRLHELALSAVKALEEALGDDDVQARLRASREVLDRAGVPRTERVETAESDVDFSSLTPEERAQLRALLTKAGGVPEAGGHA